VRTRVDVTRDDLNMQGVQIARLAGDALTNFPPPPGTESEREQNIMTYPKPTVVLVHGAFAESASWNGVVEELLAKSLDVVAVANPLRGVTGDAAYLRDVIAGLGKPVVLVGHSYGGLVITEAAANNESVTGLVYVCAFAPEHDENAIQPSSKFPGSTLGEALVAYPVSTGGNELVIRQDVFHHQFAADVPAAQAALMAATQRPVTEAALVEGLPSDPPAWNSVPSWFVFGDQDLNIPVAMHRFMAERANSKGTREVLGASHALSVSNPDVVAASIFDAVDANAPVNDEPNSPVVGRNAHDISTAMSRLRPDLEAS
jgi:pimeloyl-ACP methyl ester carboxylesterase